MRYYREHPDEPISHDWYAGGRRVKPIEVIAISGEPTRFWARSRSRPEMLHVIDLQYQESQEDKPHPKCSCEESFAKGNVCAHIGAVIQYLLDDKAQRIKDGLEEPERNEDDPRLQDR